ncbi:Ovate domain-containing protein [Cephalotus follicularis]|uniref:Transcription repressor n=1 Tax=Cephalotus follicularis TaxID=3775 RepID=A0A1Q3CPR3_CEPFO|nr:Ovate domain-containing protein [Cephalotus follicularis]
MENRLKRMIRASLGSCRPRNLSEIIEKAVFIPKKQKNHEIMEPLSPKPRPFPSICRPAKTIDHSIIRRQKVSERCSPFISDDNIDGQTCPPVSPISPLNLFNKDHFGSIGKGKETVKNRKTKKKKNPKTYARSKSRDVCFFSSSSLDSTYFNDMWFSSDDEETDREDETETLFSSRSLSSDSSRSRKHRSHRRRAKKNTESCEVGVLPLKGKVKDSFAVVKSSNDPYNDFRTSMVEMIVEKQIFAAKDLEQLLQCFLSLNSYRHHRIIVEVFTEIWDALFSNWC